MATNMAKLLKEAVDELVKKGHSRSQAMKLAKEGLEEATPRVPKPGIVRESTGDFTGSGQLELPFDAYPKASPLRSRSDIPRLPSEPSVITGQGRWQEPAQAVGLPGQQSLPFPPPGGVTTAVATKTSPGGRIGGVSAIGDLIKNHKKKMIAGALGAGGLGVAATRKKGNPETFQLDDGGVSEEDAIDAILTGKPLLMPSHGPQSEVSRPTRTPSPMLSAVAPKSFNPTTFSTPGSDGTFTDGEDIPSRPRALPDDPDDIQPFSPAAPMPTSKEGGGINWMQLIQTFGPLLAALLYARKR